MGGGKKRVLLIGITLIFATSGSAIVVAILLPSIWTYLVVLGIISLNLYFLYVGMYQKKKPRYPMVPPEGKPDVYFPRSDIPRPIHADARRTQEKKRWLARIEKMRRRKKKE